MRKPCVALWPARSRALAFSIALLPLAALLACGPARGQADAGGCTSATAIPTALSPDDSADRDAFGLRLLGAHAEAIAQARNGLPGMGAAQAVPPANATERLLRRFSAQPDAATATAALQRGDFALARAQWTDALAKARRERNVQAEGSALNDLGVLDAMQGRPREARERFHTAAALFARDQQRSSAGQADAMAAAQTSAEGMNAPPSVGALRERLAALMAAANQAARQATDGVGGRIGRLVSLLNEANLVASLGLRAEAEPLFKQAADEQATGGDIGPDLRSQVMGDLALFYRKAGRAAQAESYARLARAGAPADADLEDNAITLPMWLLGDARGTAAVASAAGDCATQLASEQPSGDAEASHRWITAQAQRFEDAGDTAAAMAAHGRAAFLASVIGSPERERTAQAALQRLALARGEAGAAILYGKLAVNASQRLRGGVEGLSRQARQAFLADRRAPYASLAGSLLDRGRLAEAEAVLRLLKEDEGQQFLDPAATSARGSVPMTLAEAAWLRRLDALTGQARARYAERQALVAQAWVRYGVGADRAQQEQAIVSLTLDTAEQWVRGLEGRGAAEDEQSRRTRALVAKPRAARSAQEQDIVEAMQAIAARGLTRLDELAAALHALPGQAQGFRQPLEASQARRAAALEQRLPPVRALWQDRTRVFAAEAPPKALSPQAQSIVNLADAAMGGASEQMRRLWAIDRQVEALETGSEALQRELAAGFGDATAVGFDAAAEALLAQGQRTLAQLPAGAVALYYLQRERRLDALVVSARERRAVPLTGDSATLATRIARLRSGIERASPDVLADARALYDTLWRPLEAPLREAEAQTVMLSLDGALHALPFAALHDGRQWLVERHALDVYTSAGRAALTVRPAPHWRVTAFGASAGGLVQGVALTALPGVREELGLVVQSGPAGAARGVLPGAALLDGAFSAAALRDTLRQPAARRPAVLHFASHFVFVAGDVRRSALLLGDGSALTLAELGGADYRFDGIDLVTLSACRTALTGTDAFGQEVEGLGTLLQAQGGAAVLATLWSVDDGSTAAFMGAMYALRERDGLSRAEAIRQAQLKLIRGEITPQAPTLAPRRSGGRDDGESGGRWTHPFHWAPFVLMGNWL